MSIVLDGTTGITTPDINTTAQSTDIISTGDIEAVDATLSGGVYLGGTGAANHLDDYEEGTWTPTYVGTASDPTVTYDAFTGAYYTKIGRQVTITGTIRTDAVSGGSGALRVGGLPFASADNSPATARNAESNGVAIAADGWTNGSAPRAICLFNSRSEANLRKKTDSDNNDEFVDVSELTNGADKNRLSFTLTYFTA
jgi:hypothetical protein